MKKKQLIIAFPICFLLVVISALISPGKLLAEGTTLTVSPAIFRIEAKPPADIWAPFTVENQSNQPVSLKIGYKPFDSQASHNGTVIFQTNGQSKQGQDSKIFEKMQVVDDQNISHDAITLGPKQKERFRLRILLPANEPSSDYYFSLLFLQSPQITDQKDTEDSIENQKSSSTLQAGVGVTILLAVGDKETPLGSIDSFTAPWFAYSGPISFNLSLHNSGTHFIVPKGEIVVQNMFGQTVGKIPLSSSIILAGTSRTISGSPAGNNASTTGDTSSSSLVWPEHFLLGTYTATVTLSLSDKGPLYIRTIHFFVFPVIALCGIFLVLAVIAYLYLRVKKKLS